MQRRGRSRVELVAQRHPAIAAVAAHIPYQRGQIGRGAVRLQAPELRDGVAVRRKLRVRVKERLYIGRRLQLLQKRVPDAVLHGLDARRLLLPARERRSHRLRHRYKDDVGLRLAESERGAVKARKKLRQLHAFARGARRRKRSKSFLTLPQRLFERLRLHRRVQRRQIPARYVVHCASPSCSRYARRSANVLKIPSRCVRS